VLKIALHCVRNEVKRCYIFFVEGGKKRTIMANWHFYHSTDFYVKHKIFMLEQ